MFNKLKKWFSNEKLENLEEEVFGTPEDPDNVFSFFLTYGRKKGLRKEIDGLKEETQLLRDYLKVEKKTIYQKTILVKSKK